MLRQYELVDLVRDYNPDVDEGLLNRAYVFAMKAHGSQTRHSGDPYFSHPIEVAGILTKLRLDTATIATALLHDTVEDTEATYEDIQDRFGQDVADLVDGVTKLSHIQFTDKQAKQAENFRKFFLATSKDVRVLLVKLADRLHNMRTIDHVPDPDKQRAIAQETLEIYAPLAGRIGMQGFREEFEDRAFEVLYPDARESIVKRLTFLTKESGDSVERITEEIKASLTEVGIDALVYGRRKRPYSVWRKMQRKAVSFEQLSDIAGFRVIVDGKAQCYAALGVVHSKWKVVPGRFKDYISTPKRNGYQSIHTTVYGPDVQRVELQIRTRTMHEVAETGVAAHWDYKEQTYKISDDVGVARDAEALRSTMRLMRENLFQELRGLADLFDSEESSQDFLEHTKMEMYTDQVFAFTPDGDLISLPRGATAIDFAYAVHTQIGDTCVGAKINGLHRPLSTPLQNGDSVEVLTSDAQGPTPDWESYVVTGRARSAIRRHVKQVRRAEFIDVGRNLLKSALRKRDFRFSNKGVASVLDRLQADNTEDVYAAIGDGTMDPEAVIEAMYPGAVSEAEPAKKKKKKRAKKKVIGPDTNGAADPASVLSLSGVRPGAVIHLAGCCHPVLGDRIVGLAEPGEGIRVHTIDCETLKEEGADWIDLSWDKKAGGEFRAVGQIVVWCTNEPGVLGEIASAIARQGGNITNVRFNHQDDLVAELTVDISVEDVKHLSDIIVALRATPVVESVQRVRGQTGDAIEQRV